MDSLSAGREDRVANRRNDDRQARFADSRWFFLAHYDVDFGLRSFADTRHLVVVEIRLLDAASADGNSVVQSGRDAVYRGALDLSAYALRIERTAAIHGVNQSLHLHAAVLDADFGDSGCVAFKGIVSRDAASDTFWKRLAPAGLFGSEAKNALEPGSVQRLVFLRGGEGWDFPVLSDEPDTEFPRVGARCPGQLVHERVDDKAAGGMLA